MATNPYAAIAIKDDDNPYAKIAIKPEPMVNHGMPTAGAHADETGIVPYMRNIESDLRGGGSRTIVGRGLGILQGRGDKGYSGLESGTTPKTADIVGSVPLGLAHAATGVAETATGSNPIKGPLDTASGLLQATTIPQMMIMGPETEEAVNGVRGLISKIPLKSRAIRNLNEVSDAAAKAGVTVEPQNAWPEIERFRELSSRGGASSKPINQFARRMAGQVRDPDAGPMSFQEGRDFYSNISGQSAEQQSKLNPTMRRQMGAVRAGLDQDLTNAADKIGLGDQYGRGIDEFARAMRLRENARKGLKYVVGPAAGAAIGTHFATPYIRHLIGH